MTWPWEKAAATCAFCDAGIPKNDLLKEFPVGKRIAYDPERGRLWSVCPQCRQWNMAALDAAEQAAVVEQLDLRYFMAPKRSENGGIGTVELGEGVSLVRVETRDRRAVAAWRFGRTFPLRRARWLALIVLIGWFSNRDWDGWLLEHPLAAVMVGAAVVATMAWAFFFKVVAEVPLPDGRRARMNAMHEWDARVESGSFGWSLHVRHSLGESTLTGAGAEGVLRRLLARRNHDGAAAEDVDGAIALIERAGGDAGMAALIRAGGGEGVALIRKLPKTVRVAMEIALNEAEARGAGVPMGTRSEAQRAAQRAEIAATL